ncbi:hypothetical protein [Helicobacter bilis]|nr:hypothetical protein [Helicobacter bilis]
MRRKLYRFKSIHLYFIPCVISYLIIDSITESFIESSECIE